MKAPKVLAWDDSVQELRTQEYMKAKKGSQCRVLMEKFTQRHGEMACHRPFVMP